MNKKEISAIFGSGLENEVQMIICTMDKDNNLLEFEKVETAKKETIKLFTETFGGATITEAAGTWLANGQLEQEKNYVISSNADDSSMSSGTLKLIKEQAEKVKELLQQDAVSVKVNGTLFFI